MVFSPAVILVSILSSLNKSRGAFSSSLMLSETIWLVFGKIISVVLSQIGKTFEPIFKVEALSSMSGRGEKVTAISSGFRDEKITHKPEKIKSKTINITIIFFFSISYIISRTKRFLPALRTIIASCGGGGGPPPPPCAGWGGGGNIFFA